MGIGRRKFISLVSAAIGGLVIDPYKSVITNQDVYINKKLGILFQKPSLWNFLGVKDLGKLKEEQVLGNGWNDYKDEVWEEIGEPICIATKYSQDLPKYKGVFSPTITLQVTHKSELDDIEYESMEDLMAISEYGTSQLLTDFRVIKKYNPYFISNCKFHEYDAEYLFEHVDIKSPLKVELKVLKAEHNNFYYDFNCHQSKEQNQIANVEFEKFKQSIKLI